MTVNWNYLQIRIVMEKSLVKWDTTIKDLAIILLFFSNIYTPCLREHSGGHLNKKDGLTRYGDSHVKDKTS